MKFIVLTNSDQSSSRIQALPVGVQDEDIRELMEYYTYVGQEEECEEIDKCMRELLVLCEGSPDLRYKKVSE